VDLPVGEADPRRCVESCRVDRDTPAGLDAAAGRRTRLVLHAEPGAPRQAGGIPAAVAADGEVRREVGRGGVEIEVDGRPGRDDERVGGGSG